jgi:VWFA-related protein
MKKTRAPLALLATLCSLFAPALAQQPTQTHSPTPHTPSPSSSQSPPAPRATPPVAVDEEEVVRITTNLVQLDVLVTDKHGKQVTDLKPEDFQMLEDGKPQKITNFSYVTTQSPAATPTPAPTPKPDKNAPPEPPAPPRKLKREEVRRTIALVVDDLSISYSDIYYVRHALRKYIDRYLGDGDLVAIMRTSAGAGAAQQFTNDRRLLYAAIERVRPYLAGNGRMGVFAPVENQNTGMSPNGMAGSDDSSGSTRGGSQSRNSATRDGSSSSGANQKDEADSFREDYFTVGTLGALRYVVNGMSELPGRKSIILFSPGFNFSVKDPDDPRYGSNRVLVAARHLVDLANRAAVVIYAIDPRGLVTAGLTAEDSGVAIQDVGSILSARSAELFDTQGGNQFLAEQTGGLSFINSNNILPAPRILEDLKGYYLIGYRPQGETFDRRFHTFTTKLLNHPDLRVRTRHGFYGVATDEARGTAKRTREQQFIASLLSPIASGDVGLLMTALFTNTERAGSRISAQLRVDARDLQFTKQSDGKYQAKLDVLGITFADTGAAVDQRGITQTLDLPEEFYRRALRDGIIYTINIPLKKPGAYQLRVALRDNSTDRIGSASQFIEVPDLKKNRLSLSGVVMSGETQASVQAKGAGGEAAAQASTAREGEIETLDPESSPAVRHFRPQQTVDYACVIFNGRTDKTHPQPQLTAEVRLYRDGAVVFAGKEQPVLLTSQTDPRRLIYAGRLTLGANLPPGDYALQVVVTDTLRDDKYRVTSQWIDFEIVQ